MHNLKHMRIEKNGVSLQEFVTIYNLVQDFNQNNPTDIITFNINDYTGTGMKRYFGKELEELLTYVSKLDNKQEYYFIFTSKDIKYHNETGRISEISMNMDKR